MIKFSRKQFNDVLREAVIFRVRLRSFPNGLVRSVLLFMIKCEEDVGGKFTTEERWLAKKLFEYIRSRDDFWLEIDKVIECLSHSKNSRN